MRNHHPVATPSTLPETILYNPVPPQPFHHRHHSLSRAGYHALAQTHPHHHGCATPTATLVTAENAADSCFLPIHHPSLHQHLWKQQYESMDIKYPRGAFSENMSYSTPFPLTQGTRTTAQNKSHAFTTSEMPPSLLPEYGHLWLVGPDAETGNPNTTTAHNAKRGLPLMEQQETKPGLNLLGHVGGDHHHHHPHFRSTSAVMQAQDQGQVHWNAGWGGEAAMQHYPIDGAGSCLLQAPTLPNSGPLRSSECLSNVDVGAVVPLPGLGQSAAPPRTDMIKSGTTPTATNYANGSRGLVLSPIHYPTPSDYNDILNSLLQDLHNFKVALAIDTSQSTLPVRLATAEPHLPFIFTRAILSGMLTKAIARLGAYRGEVRHSNQGLNGPGGGKGGT